MYEIVKKYYKLYLLIYGPDENVVIRVLPSSGLLSGSTGLLCT